MRSTLVLVLVLAAALPIVGACKRQVTAGSAPSAATVSTAGPTTITVYVPCGMTVPFHEAIDLFQAANPDITVKATYDNDALLLNKVADEGERPDVFVSPGGRELAVLSEKGLTDDSATVRMGSFTVVAAVRRDWAGSLSGPEDLAGSAVSSISLPDPDRSSLAWSVRQSLRKLGLWDTVEPKIKPAGRIIEAYDQLLKGEVDLTFTYRGCPLPKDPKDLAQSKARIAFELPVDSYDEPQVAVGVLTSSSSAAAAKRFVSFLGSEATIAMMVGKGLSDERGTTLLAAQVVESSAPSAQPVGEAPGPLAIEGFFPDDDRHRDVRAFLASLESRYEGRVKVTVHDFHNPEGDPEGFRKWQDAGFGCAGLLVGGRNKLTIGEGSAGRQVTFQRKMGVNWSQEDLLAAIDQALAQRSSGGGRP